MCSFPGLLEFVEGSQAPCGLFSALPAVSTPLCELLEGVQLVAAAPGLAHLLQLLLLQSGLQLLRP